MDLIKQTIMRNNSLNEFNSLIDSHYLSMKSYIISSNNKKVILEDYENYAWGKNEDLNPLFEKPSPLPIKSMDVEYKERDCVFLITLHLK